MEGRREGRKFLSSVMDKEHLESFLLIVAYQMCADPFFQSYSTHCLFVFWFPDFPLLCRSAP